MQVPLIGGTATVASGRDLTAASILGVYLQTPGGTPGVVSASFVAGPNGNVTVTSSSALDTGTYAVVFASAV